MDILTFSHVSKSFGSNKVIDDLSFSVPEHSVFGFIGQNGAGKTTAMKMILGLLEPDSGEIFVHGEQVRFGQNHTNKYIGYLSDVPEFYDYMTPKEYLALCGRITGMTKDVISQQSERLLDLVGLEHTDRRIRGFSRGMNQRLGIAQALLNRPKLLICDEPTSALDPLGRKEILDILSSVKENTTVFFSTHILSDVERICDKITFLHNKTAVLCGSIDEIKTLRTENGLELEFYKPEDACLFSDQYPGGTRIGGSRLRFDRKSEQDMMTIMQVLVRHNIAVRRLEMLEPALEDLFMEVVRK